MKVLALAWTTRSWHKVLALALTPQALALTPQALALVLALKVLALARPRPRLYPQDPSHVVAVCVCSAQTHSVT